MLTHRGAPWPASFDVLWQRLIERQGRQSGTRAMIAVIQLGKEFGHDAVRQAVDSAVKLGCSDSAAIRYLLTCAGQRRPVLEMAEIGALRGCPIECGEHFIRLFFAFWRYINNGISGMRDIMAKILHIVDKQRNLNLHAISSWLLYFSLSF
jgi:hypothetical protein